MLTRNAVLKTTRQFVAELKAEGVVLRKAVLFGSFAKNTPHEDSDIDVLLVADEFVGFGPKDKKDFMRVLIKRDFFRIQAFTYSTADYLENDPFTEEINATGIVLFDNLTEQKKQALAA